MQNQLEALLEEAHIKLSRLVSDLLGASARRMLNAVADGETDPAALAAMAHQRPRATRAQLHDALGACTELDPVYRRLIKMTLEGLRIVELRPEALEQILRHRIHTDAIEGQILLRLSLVRSRRLSGRRLISNHESLMFTGKKEECPVFDDGSTNRESVLVADLVLRSSIRKGRVRREKLIAIEIVRGAVEPVRSGFDHQVCSAARCDPFPGWQWPQRKSSRSHPRAE